MTRIVIDPEACVGCGDCNLICPVSVFTALPASRQKESNQFLKRTIFTNMDVESCCGESCRACQYGCWKGAIKVTEK